MNLQYITLGLQILTIIFIPIIKYWFAKQDEKDKENKCDIKELSVDLNKFKENVSDNYLKKDDYFSTIGSIAKKVDEINDIVREIKGELKARKNI